MPKLFTQLIIFLLLSANTLLSQSQFSWVETGGGEFHDRGRAICSDLNGNVYITGIVDQNASFGQFDLNSNWEDIFVVKYDSAGTLLWAKKAGSSLPLDGGFGICADALGNCYVTGAFQGTAYFDNDSITSSGDRDIFIAKYDSGGNVIWVQRAGGTSEDIANGITIDALNNIYITGSVIGDADFGNINLMDAYAGGNDYVLAKYDSNGNCIWAKKEEASNATAEGISIDADQSGNIYVTGDFVGLLPFGNDTIFFGDSFIVKYDTSGNQLWIKEIHAGQYSVSTALAATHEGGCVVSGFYTGSVTFDSISLTSYGNEDIYLARYDENGNALWARHAGGVDRDRGFGVDVSPYGHIAVTGRFEGTAQFDGISINSLGHQDIFVAKYDGNGNVIWALDAGSSTNIPLAYEETGYDVEFDDLNNCYVTGLFKNTAEFPPFSVTSSNYADVFLAKIGAEDLGNNEAESYHTEIVIYPNPSRGKFLIKTTNANNAPIEISIVNLLGESLNFEQNPISSNEIEIRSSQFSSGVYLLKVTQGAYTKSSKIILN